MASAPSSLQLRIALNYESFKAAPARAKMTKLSRRVRMSCAAENAESGRWLGGSDRFRGWADSGDDEWTADWFKGTLVSGVAGMVLFVGALSFKRHVFTTSMQHTSDQVGATCLDGNNVMDKESCKDSLSNENHGANKASELATNATTSPVPQVNPLTPIFPTLVHPIQSQMFSAIKVIEFDSLPYDLCTRREFARWLVSASSALSRNSASKVYPAMYAFDDITPEDPDFSFIQGLAEAGSKLFNHNMPSAENSQFKFSPESPLSRQDLLSWKMTLEFRQLPEADSKKLYQLFGFLDIDKINPEAWPALIADLSAGEHGIIALAFGHTRLFQPSKAVTKAQTAASFAIGEACEAVSEELARIHAESMAENVVSAHSELFTQVETDINASFEKELLREKEIVDAVVKFSEEAKLELTRLRVEKEEETLALEKERTSIETEMESLARLRNELEEQLQSLVNNKTEISWEKESFYKLQKQVENENQEILRLQNELDVERNALSIARDWAEDEARRATEQAKVLEEARGRWEKYGLKVIVDRDLHEQTTTESTWLNAGKQYSVEGTMNRAQNVVAKLKNMAQDVSEKPSDVIYSIIEEISLLISALKKQVHGMSDKVKEVKMKTKSRAEELRKQTSLKIGEIKDVSMMKAKEAVEEFKDRVWKLKSK